MFPCAKGHPHNTRQGSSRCDLKYADKRIARMLKDKPPIYRKIVHQPAKVVDKGGVMVYVYQEAEVVHEFGIDVPVSTA